MNPDAGRIGFLGVILEDGKRDLVAEGAVSVTLDDDTGRAIFLGADATAGVVILAAESAMRLGADVGRAIFLAGDEVEASEYGFLPAAKEAREVVNCSGIARCPLLLLGFWVD